MENIITLPESEEKKLKMNQNFRAGLIKYDLKEKIFRWNSQIEYDNPPNYSLN